MSGSEAVLYFANSMIEGSGPNFLSPDTVEFRVFSSKAGQVSLCLGNERLPMEREADDGLFRLETKAQAGMLYGFSVDSGPCYPDPASRFQPEGVHEKSELISPKIFSRKQPGREPITFDDLILYELHIGTFTAEGTYRSTRERLPDLVELGVNAIEILPLAQAAGNWNWGYDGVNLFAPNHAYGRPEELVALVDAAHELGLAVILDVVYNHLGPEGNYLFALGGYLSSRHTTPWGDAPNFDGKESKAARELILENARYWIEDVGFDGLRVDATHFIKDESDPHIATELGSLIRRLEKRLERPLYLIGETNVYDAALIQSVGSGGSGFDGIWCDEFLHSFSAQVNPREQMTSRQYRAGEDLATVLESGFVYEGTLRNHFQRASRQKNSQRPSLEPIVASIQNHDFIGNHPSGRRLHKTTCPDAQRAAAALLLLLPSVPMLFMGEEFASNSPFYFFVDFQDKALRKAVERGRIADHPQHDWSQTASPTSPDAFHESKIEETTDGDQEMLDWYKKFIALRKEWKRDGFLNSESMNAEWIEENQLAYVRYMKNREVRFLVVRLHPVESSLPPLRFEIEGNAALSQNYRDGIGSEFLVVAGRGHVKFL